MNKTGYISDDLLGLLITHVLDNACLSSDAERDDLNLTSNGSTTTRDKFRQIVSRGYRFVFKSKRSVPQACHQQVNAEFEK